MGSSLESAFWGLDCVTGKDLAGGTIVFRKSSRSVPWDQMSPEKLTMAILVHVQDVFEGMG